MQVDKSKYIIYNWKHPLVLHWIVNPGLAFNELFLGQRIPKVSLVDKTSKEALADRTYVPCPHCNTIHSGKVWDASNGTAFKNWFGYYCPSCGDVIPCLMNATTFIILLLTSPLWFWFKDSLYKAWLEKQPQRYRNIQIKPSLKFAWVATGLIFGFLMFLFQTLTNMNSLTWKHFVFGVPVHIVGGLAFGYIMKLFTAPKKKMIQENEIN